MNIEGGQFMTPQRKAQTDFQQVLIGTKLLIKFDRLETNFQVPKTRGFRVQTAFEEMSPDQEFMQYFPDIPPKTNIPRDYILTVIIKSF